MLAVDTNAVSLTYGAALTNGATWAKFVNGQTSQPQAARL